MAGRKDETDMQRHQRLSEAVSVMSQQLRKLEKELSTLTESNNALKADYQLLSQQKSHLEKHILGSKRPSHSHSHTLSYTLVLIVVLVTLAFNLLIYYFK
eukprot:TRINITY_DN10029_c0_g6_i1.p1 TRINITY_DN10029_c0_g6~~TRINITY_DN10029_c0_g6_i1.p1  ORF type:complete len:100 (-),score=4.74 TRINITY_DN10029_c0_g6_i1:62-361(-)